MPTQVTYNGKRLIPAPLVSVQKTYQKTGDGTVVGSLFDITLTGSLVAFKGSPLSNGTWYTGGSYPPDESIGSDSRLSALQVKQEALRELFSQDGYQLEFQAADGSPPMKCNPQVINISFAEGVWFNTVQYTITLQANALYVAGSPIGEDGFTEYIESASENWNFEVQDDQRSSVVAPTYRLTHSIQAKGKTHYNSSATVVKPAWQEARDFVLPRLGLDNIFSLASGVNNLPGYYNGYNHQRTNTQDELDGTFSVTETWVLASGDAIEDFNVNYSHSAEDGRKQVTVDGTITGFETKNANMDVTKTKYVAAKERYSIASGIAHTRAQSFAGVSNLNIVPLNTTVGRNPIQGTITYSFEYDNRPSNLITGTKSEVISIGTNWGINAFASLTVLNRAKGPLLQNLGTYQQATRSLNMELVFGSDYVQTNGQTASAMFGKNPRLTSPQAAQIQSVVNAAHPISGGATNNVGSVASVAYVTAQNESWDVRTGRYSLQIEWAYE